MPNYLSSEKILKLAEGTPQKKIVSFPQRGDVFCLFMRKTGQREYACLGYGICQGYTIDTERTDGKGILSHAIMLTALPPIVLATRMLPKNVVTGTYNNIDGSEEYHIVPITDLKIKDIETEGETEIVDGAEIIKFPFRAHRG